MNDILVSVVIPTYKRPDTLVRAIDSVCSQSYDNIEIIVVDDNDPSSSFRKLTEKVMEQYVNNSQVKYIKHPFNKNGSAARNTGISASNGKYVAFLDDDDEFKKDKILIQLTKMEQLDSSWAACYTGFEKRKNGKLFAKGAEKKQGYVLCDALARNFYICAGSNLFVRKNVLNEINGFDENFIRNQDLELLVRILHKYKIARCDKNCLIIHARVRTTDVEAVTNTFLSTFSMSIEEMEISEKRKIYFLINLQLIRYWLIRKKNYKKSIQILKENNISYLDLSKYFLHLLKRYIRREIYGYPIKKIK